MNFNKMFTEIHNADLVVTFSYRDGISIIKNRTGDIGKVDFAGFLEAWLNLREDEPYRGIVMDLVKRIKNLRAFV